MSNVYTLGHSTRDLAEFSAVLQAHEIQLLVDIRAFPASKRLPHFNRERLEWWLPEIGLEYRWMKELGGRRKKILADSPNIALRNDSFRNYADYMLTGEFQSAANDLAKIAESHRAAIMCAEKMYFQCHRMLVSDFLVSQGHPVLHIIDEKPPREHKMMDEARIVEGKLIYIGDRLL